MSTNIPSPKTYDHRLRNLVYTTKDVSLALDLGVPRSTAYGWVRNEPPEVITLDALNLDEQQLQYELIRIRKRCRRLIAVVRLLVVFVRTFGIRIDFSRIPDGKQKMKLLRVIDSARLTLALGSVLKIIGISSSRYYLWEKKQQCNNLDDESSCPKTSVNQLTIEEVFAIKDMATSDEYRHVPTNVLSVLAQRLGKVFASASTWHKLIKERGWRRPRKRLHPAKPKVGIRTERPDEKWHIDTSVIKLLDGTKAYIHGVIDNHSRRILSWLVTDHFDIQSTIKILLEATQASLSPDIRHSFICDSGVENINDSVDELLRKGFLKRILAYVELDFSNSMIESFWRALKHQWLFLNTLDNITTLRRLVAFYVNAHNTQMPHSAFNGQTPDEIYYGTGDKIPQKLKDKRDAARSARIEVNRAMTCDACLNRKEVAA
jgi:putative transposase